MSWLSVVARASSSSGRTQSCARLCVQSSGVLIQHFSINRACSAQRQFVSSARSRQQQNVQALIGYAFTGKPRSAPANEDEDESLPPDTPPHTPKSPPPQPQRQGFASETEIGQWVDAMLRQPDGTAGEAGEDMLAVIKMRGQGDWLLAVADGVGGWSENGIDPALFSQALLFNAARYAQQFYACPDRFGPEDLADSANAHPTQADAMKEAPSNDILGTPLDILNVAHRHVDLEPGVLAGSSTACVLTFDASKGILRAANLGDSGFVILRTRSPNDASRGSSSSSIADSDTAEKEPAADEDPPPTAGGLHVVHYQSHPQLHGFNTPFQLSKLPPSLRSSDSIDSMPKDAHISQTRVREGDIVLLATDGFWDNVSTAEVLQLVAFIRQKHRTAWQKSQKEQSQPPQIDDPLAEERDLANVLAHNLLQYALICQFSTNKTSPFEREARRHGIHFPGGKVDDISIVAALIVER